MNPNPNTVKQSLEDFRNGKYQTCDEIIKEIKMINEYEVHFIPLEDIFCDDEFNSRNRILPMDVADLARDIDRNGLQTPISVQPWDGDKKYRIVAGHRRFTAFKILKKDTIPAMIKEGLTEVQARLMNLKENLIRSELDIMQEAGAVKALKDLGMTQDAISFELKKSRGWVQVRFNLLELPQAIQDEAAAGILNQAQIKQIYGLNNEAEQYAAVKKIKESRIRGIKGVDVGKKPKEKPFIKKRQSKNNVQEMIEHIGKHVGYGLTTRALAWANGNINSAELYYDIKKEVEDAGGEYDVSFLTRAYD